MKCIKCGAKTGTVDSRYTFYGKRRMLECTECHHRFPTVEIPMSEYKSLVDLRCKYNAMVDFLKGGAE